MKNKLINLLLTIIVVACFLGAGYMGWLFYQEMHTTSEAKEDTNDLRAAVVQVVSETATPEVVITTAEQPEHVESTSLPDVQTEQPAATEVSTAAPEEGEPDAEEDEDDARLLVILHNQSEGYDVLSTPAPSAPVADLTTVPAETPAPENTAGESPAVSDTSTQEPENTPLPSESTSPTADISIVSTPTDPVSPEETTETIQTEVPADTEQVTETPTDSPEPTATPYVPLVGKSVTGTLRMTVDFSALAAVNPDIRAWIFQEGTEINYPIVQSTDNEYYLTHLFSRRQNKTGTLFMDYANSAHFSDMVTMVYGHNRKDQAMFASIPSYKDQEYYEAHPTMDLITPYENYLLEIFSLVRISNNDGSKWRVKTFSNRDAFEEYTSKLLEMSYIDTGVVPEWGDQLIALATCTNEVHDERYVLYARMRPVVYSADSASITVTKQAFDKREGTSRIIDVPSRGPMQYYAQNDPTWSKLVYENKGAETRRTVGASACGPTSMSIVLANLISEEYFWYLSYYSGLDTGIIFCEESVNQYYCTHTHAQYRLEQPWEYRRYLPVAMCSFCTGNNCWKEKYRTGGGTGSGLFGRIAQIYGLTITLTRDETEIVSLLQAGAVGIVNVGKGNIYTGGGHYMAVVAADDQYIYIMDPYLKDNYSKTDTHHRITVIEPGLIRMNRSDWRRLDFGQFYLFQKLD